MPAHEAVGEWDLYTELLERYHLPPAAVDDLDPDFVTELTARWKGQRAVQETAARRQAAQKNQRRR